MLQFCRTSIAKRAVGGPSVRNGLSAMGMGAEKYIIRLRQLLHLTLRDQSEVLGFAQESALGAYQWVMGEPKPCD